MKLSTLVFVVLFSLQCAKGTSSPEVQPPILPPGSDAPLAEPPIATEKFRFAVISDLNGSYGSTSYNHEVRQAVEWIGKNQIPFVLSTGDMVAGQKSGLDYQAMWSAFHSAVTTPLQQAGVSLLPSPGNHDAYFSLTTERRHYEQTWQTRNAFATSPHLQLVAGVTQNFPFQYAFRVGSGLFIAMDSTATRPWSNQTLKWLKKVLEQESEVGFKVIYGHVPLLPFAFRKEREYVARGSFSFLQELEGLLEKHQVDLFLSGHSHVYYPGHREAHTLFVSVPLLGSGLRYLIHPQSAQREERGFLVVEYDGQGNWSMESRRVSDFSLITNEELPTGIQLPANDSSLCRYCSQFPSSHFLDSKKRIIYKRQDL